MTTDQSDRLERRAIEAADCILANLGEPMSCRGRILCHVRAFLMAQAQEEREVCTKLMDQAYDLIDQLSCLAMPHHPSLYERAQQWKEAIRARGKGGLRNA